MIPSVVPTLPRKIAARSPLFAQADVRQRPKAVAGSDGATLAALSDGEALVMDVRAGVTPAEHVQRKLTALLEARSAPIRR